MKVHASDAVPTHSNGRLPGTMTGPQTTIGATVLPPRYGPSHTRGGRSCGLDGVRAGGAPEVLSWFAWSALAD